MSSTSMPNNQRKDHPDHDSASDNEHDGQPPQDLTAERSVLGAGMLSKDAIGEIEQALSADDLYRPAHQAIWRCVIELYSHGHPVDPITVAAALDHRGELARAGGAPYLHTLIAEVPTASNAGYYADLVAGKAALRRMVQAGTQITQLGQWGSSSTGPELGEVFSRAQHALDHVSGTRQASDDGSFLADMALAAMDALEAVQTGTDDTGISTGITDLDELTTGLRPGQLVTVAARPGVGKSVLGIQIARHAAIQLGHTSVIFSLEMGKNEIMNRVFSAEARVRLQDMRSQGRMSDDDWARITDRLGDISESPLIVDDSPGLTITDIRGKARRFKQHHDLRLVVVDYLQLMTSSGRAERREQEVAEFSRQLKLLAKELAVPVLALSQLNRGSESRADKRPMLADLRESGAIEQDSDIVILIDRPDVRERDDPRAGEADLILAKHRDGPMSTVSVAHQLHYSRFADLA